MNTDKAIQRCKYLTENKLSDSIIDMRDKCAIDTVVDRVMALQNLYNDACKSIATDTVLKDAVVNSIEWHKNALKFDCNGNADCYNYAIEVLTALLKTIAEVGD